MNDQPLAPGLLTRLSRPPDKVALLRTTPIGGFLCATPAFRALRRALPDSEIVLVARETVRPLAERLASLDRFESFPTRARSSTQAGINPEQVTVAESAGVQEWEDFLNRVGRRQFDLVIQMNSSEQAWNLFALMLGAPTTAGMIGHDGVPTGLNAAYEARDDLLEVDRLLGFAEFLGAEPQGEQMDVVITQQDRRQARRLLAGLPRPFIGLHPGASLPDARWPAERFARAGTELRRRTGGGLVVLGSEAEMVATREVARLAKGDFGEEVLDLGGKTTLPLLAAVLEELSVLITNNTGAAHLAEAVGTPTVTIVGAGGPQRYYARPDRSYEVTGHGIPCSSHPRSDDSSGYRCLQDIIPERVVEAAEAVLR